MQTVRDYNNFLDESVFIVHDLWCKSHGQVLSAADLQLLRENLANFFRDKKDDNGVSLADCTKENHERTT